MLKLAHPIKKQFRGHYTCYRFAAIPDSIAKAEHQLRIDQDVLRYLNIKVSSSHDPEKWKGVPVEVVETESSGKSESLEARKAVQSLQSLQRTPKHAECWSRNQFSRKPDNRHFECRMMML